jgi:hypothetical protein
LIKTAFIAHVESNQNKGGEYVSNRPLEEESLKCFESWRRLGGKWKDIDIYATCHTNNPPSEVTLKEYEKMNVTFVNHYYTITDEFPAGWWNVPLSGRWAEDHLDHQFLVHTDLDMILLKEPDDELMYCSQDSYARCAVYSENFPDDMQIVPEYSKLFVTCFITSWAKNKFYTLWFQEMMKQENRWTNRDWNDKENWWKYCNLEEHAVDVMFFEKGMEIEQVHKCQIGNGNAYDTVDSLTDEEMHRVFFNHDHYHDDCKQETIKQYVMRMMELKRAKR